MAEPRSGLSEVLGRLFAPPPRTRTAAGLLVAVAGPALVTVAMRSVTLESNAVPALLYLLAVVAATVTGRLWPGLVAAVLSFLGLDWYFTPPVHHITVAKAEDLVALLVFLLVAALVSAALAAALEQRSIAQFRERQVRALYRISSRLLSGEHLDSVLYDLAVGLRSLYGLQGTRVLVQERDGSTREAAVSGDLRGLMLSVSLRSDVTTVGRIEMAGGSPNILEGSEGEVLKTFAGQLALALERTRLGEEAARARLEAEANRTRAALFSSVTHDLRTPLASITASASSLLEEGVPFSNDQRRELLTTILEEGERLNRLVGNLLELSRIRAGALVPAVEAVPLEDLVSSVLRRLRNLLHGREVRVQIRESLPPVAVDVVQMDQVLTNLLENAVRYSPAGTAIGITAVRWHDMVEVRVADRGPGIPPVERPQVFQEFHRADVDGRPGGSGLGLAIAQAVVVAHGGSMWVEDTPGGGATLGFRLPLARQPEPAKPSDQEHVP